jgi:alpha-tubulin suppressor-like RCC1 family protein
MGRSLVSIDAVTTNTVTFNAWNHIAISRATGTTKIFINGVQGYSGTQSFSYPTGIIRIGTDGGGTAFFYAGYISNLRFVKNQALYTTTPFTPTTSPLTTTSQGASAANVSLLTCQSSTIKDNSNTPNIITTVNTPIATYERVPFSGQVITSASYNFISAGEGHSIATKADSTLWIWGYSNYGQGGIFTTANQSSPVQITTPSVSWVSVSAGFNGTGAIDSTNNLYVWGRNDIGQLGDNTVISKSSPIKIGTLVSTIEYSPVLISTDSSWATVSAGWSHAIGIKTNNTLWGWGYNGWGQIGDGTVINRSSPVQLGAFATVLSNANAYSLRFNGSNYLTIADNTTLRFGTNDFTIECWVYLTVVAGTSQMFLTKWATSVGYELYYQGSSTKFVFWLNAAAYLTGTTTPVVNTWYHVAVTRASGTVRLFVNGNIEASATGNSTNFNDTIPVIIGSETGASLYLNGYLSNARLVNGTAVYTAAFAPSTTSLTAITNTALLTAQNTTIVDNSTNAFTITNTGSVAYNSLSPFVSAYPLLATQVSAGGTHSASVDISNRLFTWGLNNGGQLGLFDLNYRSNPTQIGIASIWNTVSTGYTHTLALDNFGTLYGWGNQGYGELGVQNTTTYSSPVIVSTMSMPNISSPTQIGTNSYSLISAGTSISTAISSNSKLFVWGYNNYGQLGIPVNINRSRPVQISLSSFNFVNAGGTHTTFIPNYSPRTIFATGYNIYGQIGDSTTINRSSPTQVSASLNTFNSPVTISTGNYSSYYVSNPTQVGTSSWTSVSAGDAHTLGIRNNNILYAWGYNANGQLADFTTINRSSPVQVGTSSWSQVSAGDLHNIIAKSDGTINTFGLNNFGQLGDGT